jgi:mono/diheme cytochrome c family protein
MINSTQVAPVRTRPIAPIAVLFVVVTIAHALLVGCGGGAKEDTTATETTPPPTETTMPDTAGGAAVAGGDEVAAGKVVYMARCALCHGPEGKGDGPASAGLNPKPRNHTDGTYMNTLSDEALLKVIHTGKGAMPAWGTILSEAEINAVAKYVRTLAK